MLTNKEENGEFKGEVVVYILELIIRNPRLS
jgi:hypothetical protein